ncbi:hypothetical protein HOH45_02490, partial [bacterium]|nr:hypothetical protein [bacterium]
SWIPALDHLLIDGTLKDDYVSMILGCVLTEKKEDPEKMMAIFIENLTTTITNQKSKNPDTVKFSKRLCIIMHNTINTLETEDTPHSPINLDSAIHAALDLTSIDVPSDLQSIETISSENSEKYITTFLNHFPKTATLIGVNPIKPTQAGKKFILRLFTHLIKSNFIKNGIINPLYQHINHDLTPLIESSGRTETELNDAIKIGLSSHITNQEETLSLFTATHIASYQRPKPKTEADQLKQTMFHHCLTNTLITERYKTIDEIKETSEKGTYDDLKNGLVEIETLKKDLHKILIKKLMLMDIPIATSVIQTLPATEKKEMLSQIAIHSNLDLAISLIKTTISSLDHLSQIDYVTQTYRSEKKQLLKTDIIQLFTKNLRLMDGLSQAELTYLKTELEIAYMIVGDISDTEEYLISDYQNKTPIKEIIEGIDPHKLLHSVVAIQGLINGKVVPDDSLKTFVNELKNHKNKLIDLMTTTPTHFYGLLEMLESSNLPNLIPNAFSHLHNIKQECDLLAEIKRKLSRASDDLSSRDIRYIELAIINHNGEINTIRCNYILSGIEDITDRQSLKTTIIAKIDLSVISKAKSPEDPKLTLCLSRFLETISENNSFLEETIDGETTMKKARDAIRRLYGISVNLQNPDSIELSKNEIDKSILNLKATDSTVEKTVVTLITSDSVQKKTLTFFKVALEKNRALVEKAHHDLLNPNQPNELNVIDFLNKVSAITQPDKSQVPLDK